MNDNRRTVGLQEHLGTGNLGDEATVDAVLQQIRLRCPDTTIVAISLNPLDTEVRHGILLSATPHPSERGMVA